MCYLLTATVMQNLFTNVRLDLKPTDFIQNNIGFMTDYGTGTFIDLYFCVIQTSRKLKLILGF